MTTPSAVEAAKEHAYVFCQRRPKWQPYCDIEDTESLSITWEELPAGYRQIWEERHRESAEAIWREFGAKPQRHRYAFIGSDGVAYDEITDMPAGVSHMMVFQTGGKAGIYYQGGAKERSRGTVKSPG